MAWTQADLDQIDAAIASAEKNITGSDGRSVTLQSIAELKERRAMIAGALADELGVVPKSRRRYAEGRSGF